jgi:hypothetical protein
LTLYLADFFLGEARKNGHVFPEERGGEVLSWAYPVVYSGPEFVQSYFFHEYHYPGKGDYAKEDVDSGAVAVIHDDEDAAASATVAVAAEGEEGGGGCGGATPIAEGKEDERPFKPASQALRGGRAKSNSGTRLEMA